MKEQGSPEVEPCQRRMTFPCPKKLQSRNDSPAPGPLFFQRSPSSSSARPPPLPSSISISCPFRSYCAVSSASAAASTSRRRGVFIYVGLARGLTAAASGSVEVLVIEEELVQARLGAHARQGDLLRLGVFVPAGSPRSHWRSLVPRPPRVRYTLLSLKTSNRRLSANSRHLGRVARRQQIHRKPKLQVGASGATTFPLLSA
ncbi:hypothetical protein K438DRAFT_1996863 [Mycena galopus ATCC 62051]|nr:hypothetical protein K438DRAFT_1996863 [Mycena galopus ATCC 62051]